MLLQFSCKMFVSVIQVAKQQNTFIKGVHKWSDSHLHNYFGLTNVHYMKRSVNLVDNWLDWRRTNYSPQIQNFKEKLHVSHQVK